MRPSMGGDLMWKMLHDVAFSADNCRQWFDLEMRIPRGNAANHIPEQVLHKPQNENSQHYFRRMVGSHLVYLQNSMVAGGVTSLLPDPNMNPLERFDPLELVNRQRKLRRLPLIGDRHLDAGPIKRDETNKIITTTVKTSDGSTETYELVFCRETSIYVSSDLTDDNGVPQGDATDRKELDQRVSLGNGQLALQPSFFDSDRETWMHRAVWFQEAEHFAKSKKGNADSVASCNGSLNRCRECNYCLANLIHKSDPTSFCTDRVNVSHRHTLHESTRLMLLALSVILPCHMCNFHFGILHRTLYFDQLVTDHSFPHDLTATLTSAFPVDAEQKKSDLFAKRLVRSAILAVSQTLPKTLKLKSGKGTNAAIASSSNQSDKVISVASSATQGESPMWKALQRGLDETLSREIDKVFLFHFKYWQNLGVEEHAIAAMKSRKNLTLNILTPTGRLLSEQWERPKNGDNDVLQNLYGKIMFPPFIKPSSSFAKQLYDTQNHVNVMVQKKPVYDWVEYTSKRFALGGAVGNPAHVWPILITLAKSIESYAIQASYGSSDKASLNTIDAPLAKHYDDRYSHFVDIYGDRESVYKDLIEPEILKMFQITGKYIKEHNDQEFLQEIRLANHGRLVVPDVPDEVGIKISVKDQNKIRLCLYRCDYHDGMHQVALSMAKEVEMGGRDRVEEGQKSWQNVTTPNAALIAFNTFLSTLVPGFYANVNYRSLVSYFWPIPKEYMTKPAEFLMIGMWRWYHANNRLLELVRDTVHAVEHSKTIYSGDTLEQSSPEYHAYIRKRHDHYQAFVNTIAALKQTEQGRKVLDSEDWQMDKEWMAHFKMYFAKRFEGQVLELKPLPLQPHSSSSSSAP